MSHQQAFQRTDQPEAAVTSVGEILAPQATTVGTTQPVGITLPPVHTPLAVPRPVPALPQPPAPGAVPAPVKPRRRRLSPSSVNPGAVIWWQLSIVAVGIGASQSVLALVLSAAGALVVVAATSVRVRGVLLYRWLAVGTAYLLRSRRTVLPDEAAGLALARLCTGEECTVAGHVIRERPVGMLSRPDAVTVAVKLRRGAHHALTDGPVTVLEAVDEQPVGLHAQLLLHTGVRPEPAPRVWITVSARRSPSVAADEELRQVLANTVRRVLRRLDRLDTGAEALNETDLLATVTGLGHAVGKRYLIRERWSSVSAGTVNQQCLRLNGFTRLQAPAAATLVDRLLGANTGSAVTLGLGASTARDAIRRYEPVVRVAAPGVAVLDSTVSVLTRMCEAYGVELVPLSGRQAHGLTASLPIGVPPAGREL